MTSNWWVVTYMVVTWTCPFILMEESNIRTKVASEQEIVDPIRKF